MQKVEKYLQISEIENKVLKLTAGDKNKKKEKRRNNQIQDLKQVSFRNWKLVKKISEKKQEILEQLKVLWNTQ